MIISLVVLTIFCGISNGALPVLLWHGMGDSGYNPGMKSFAKLIEDHNGAYVIPLTIGHNVVEDTIAGFLTPINEQVEEVCELVANDPKLKDGYHAIGFSQGGQFLRGVAQRCPDPPMKSLITFGGQHQGVFGIPRCPGESSSLCNIMRELLNMGAYNDYVQDKLVQAQYWHDPLHYDTYREKSQYIAEINNEKTVQNASYATNLARLENFVMVKFTKDKMVEPVESQHFEFYKPNDEHDIVPLKESPIYTQDRIGLKTLDEAGKLKFLNIEGDHLQGITKDWFIKKIADVYLN